jgi:hypothetical protein
MYDDGKAAKPQLAIHRSGHDRSREPQDGRWGSTLQAAPPVHGCLEPPATTATPTQQSATPRVSTTQVNNDQPTLNYHRFLLGAVLTQAPATSRILEFGAGGGEFAIPLRQLHLDITAVEPDASRRGVLLASGVRVSASTEELLTARFDLIYSLAPIRLAIDVTILRELHARLDDGGRMLLHVPAFTLLGTANAASAGQARRYTRRQLCRTARAAGFSIERAHYGDSLGCLAVLLFKLLARRGSEPSGTARRLYDRLILPVSLALNVLTRRCLGRNLLLIARKG